MQEKTILITGCSSGIGLDAARTLQQHGWRVFATCRQQKDAEQLQSEGLESFVLDYASSESVCAAAKEALERCDGKLDALFNNGAFGLPCCVEDVPRAAMREIFETNLFGQFELINQLLPAMRKQGQGMIVNNSSILGFTAFRYRGPYNATKFAMEGLSDTLRLELRGSGIHIVLIEPGPISTKIREKARPHFEKWIDVAASANRELYESTIKPRLYQQKQQPDRFELPASSVTRCLLSALNSKRPKPRYFVTTPTFIAGIGKRVLSTRVMDSILARL